jgi:hypothetical protein
MADPVIIEAAINGTTTKARNPNVPTSPDEIAADALACLDAGAAIVHNHCDRVGVPGQESADRYFEGWKPVFAKRADALIYPTTNFGPGVEGAYAHMAPLAATGWLRIGIIDPGSVNLGGTDAEGLPGRAGLRVRELLRRHPPSSCGVPGQPARAEHGDLRTGMAAHRAHLVARRPAAARRNGEAVLRR